MSSIGFPAMGNWSSTITERCEAILTKICQNSEGTEQNFARLREFQFDNKYNKINFKKNLLQ